MTGGTCPMARMLHDFACHLCVHLHCFFGMKHMKNCNKRRDKFKHKMKQAETKDETKAETKGNSGASRISSWMKVHAVIESISKVWNDSWVLMLFKISCWLNWKSMNVSAGAVSLHGVALTPWLVTAGIAINCFFLKFSSFRELCLCINPVLLGKKGLALWQNLRPRHFKSAGL